MLALGVALAHAQYAPLSLARYEAKAAFLYNFAKFVEWPRPAAGAGAPLVVVVFGGDPVAAILDRSFSGRTIGDRPLTVRRAARIEDLLPCDIVFIGAQQRRQVPDILKALEQSSVLTVAEMEDFLELGGTVRLVMENNQVRFMVNLEAARRNGLTISSKLLSLARVVNR